MSPSRLCATVACSLLGGHAYADTILTSQASFQSAVPNAVPTSSFGLPYYGTTSSVVLVDGNVLNFGAAEVAGSGTGYAPFSNGYAGDVLISNGASETIAFASPLKAFSLLLSPDVGLTLGGLFQNNASFLITLSNGQPTTISGNYDPGDASFYGFYGPGDITSMTITVSGTNGINGSAIPDFAFGDFTSVPEPVSVALLAGGILVLAAVRRRL